MICAVIADDLTGAADTAVEFAKRGHPATVLLAWEGEGLERAPVVAADTESRHLSAARAYDRCFAATTALRARGFPTPYKKMDSALRGNLGAEIDAVLDATGLQWAVVAPAFPANGRTTVGGHQCHGGVRLESTAFARDPRSPVLDSCVARVIARQSRRQTGTVGLSTVRAGDEQLVRALLDRRDRGAQIVVADAESESDLAAIASAIDRLPVPALAAGSAGLAEFLSRRLPARQATALEAAADAGPRVRSRRVLVIAGSAHPTTEEQVRRLARCDDVAVVNVPVNRDWSPASWPASRAIVLRLSGAIERPTADTGRLLCEKLARVAREALDAAASDGAAIDGLVLIGGDTAVAILGSLQASGLVIEREVEPGVPSGTIAGGAFDGMPVVTKAGAFGNERTVIAAVNWLRGA